MSDPLQFSGEETSGISEADQREIREEIERVAAENRIQVSGDLLEYTPQRNGAIFPIVANLAGLLLLGAGILVLFLLFRSEDASIRSAQQSVAATESRLIQELRRETEAQLAEKEAEIEQIVARLESISQERAALARDIEEQIRQREAELEEQFRAELEAERRRLQALNLTETEIEARLAEYEAQKRQEYNERLAAFQDRMLAERERLEEDLDSLESQFSQTLEQANQERQAILQESEARISELQSEFQARLDQSEAELSAAQRQLNRLSQSREREALIRGQITGLYGTISENLQEGAYEAALENLDTLETLLNEAATFQVDALREERATNLFMVRTLREYIRNIQETNNPETLARLSDASLVLRAQELRDEAESALQAGNEELARTLYRQALETIPAVAESFAYFETQGVQADRETAAEQNDAAAALVADAEAAAQADDHRLAVDNFAQVVQLYPNSIYRGRAINGILASVDQLQAGLEEEIAALTAERDTLELAVEEASVVTEDEVEQLRAETETQEVRIVQLEGRIDNLQSQRSALETQRETLRGQLETLQSQRDSSRERAEELESRVRQLDTDIRRLETTIVQRDQELAESRREQALLNEQLATVAEGGTADPEILEELAELRDVSRDLAAAERLYQEYLAQVATLDSDPEDVGIVEARLKLDEFLASPQLDQYFPDLREEVGRYESVYEESGRENAMVEVADLIYELSLLESTADRLRRIRRERVATDQQLMRDFLDELELLLES